MKAQKYEGYKGFEYVDEVCSHCMGETYNVPIDRISLCAHCGEEIFPCSGCDDKCSWNDKTTSCHRFSHSEKYVLREAIRVELIEKRGKHYNDYQVATGIEIYRERGGQGNGVEDIADFIERELSPVKRQWLKCLQCGYLFELIGASRDTLGWHTTCPKCNGSFDVDIDGGLIKPADKICGRCGSQVYESNNPEYQCCDCDEDLYSFEVK